MSKGSDQVEFAQRLGHRPDFGSCPKCGDTHHAVYRYCDGLRDVPPATLSGGKLTGNHYYRVQVADPISPELPPYQAECADIIEALGMTFNEGEAFKALWRLAAARQGRGKPGNAPQYDADKVAHYGARVAACVKRGA